MATRGTAFDGSTSNSKDALTDGWPESNGKALREEEEEEEDGGNNPGNCNEALITICSETSFQGVPYIVAPTPFLIRR